MQYLRTITLPCLPFALFSFSELSCPGHNFETIQGILLQLHKMIKDIERECNVQEPFSILLCLFFPLLSCIVLSITSNLFKGFCWNFKNYKRHLETISYARPQLYLASCLSYFPFIRFCCRDITLNLLKVFCWDFFQ